MICCDQCFRDKEIISIIRSFNRVGNCELCGGKQVFIYDTRTQVEIRDMFDEFLNIYSPIDSLPEGFPEDKITSLVKELHEDWYIFSFGPDKIHRFLESALAHRYHKEPDLFQGLVGVAEFYDTDYLEEHSILRNFRWEDFVESIKSEYRFHSNQINTDVLTMFFAYVRKTYLSGISFYRARVSSKNGYGLNDMGAPSVEQSVDGRANVRGIPVLYLGSDRETCIAEVRAGAHDYVSVGRFVLQDILQVVDLTAIDKISPFAGLPNVQHAVNKEHLRKISMEIAQPVRGSDSPLDYVPAQYICDFIKSIKENEQRLYGGIQHDSTRSESGFNLAIFDPTIAQCESVEVLEIVQVKYCHSEICPD